MLMPSHRHSQADLANWKTLEAADLLNYSLRKVEEKARRSLAVLADFLASGTCYASVSWGKDSMVLAHLLWQHRQRNAHGCPIYRVRMAEIENPDTDAVEAAFLSQFPLPEFEWIESPHDPAWVRAEGKRERALIAGIKEAGKRAGSTRYINGLRAQESNVRRIRMLRGLSIDSSCSPIGWWRDEDVFAYLAHHKLPVHPCYAMSLEGVFPRKHLRVCMLGNHKGRERGRLLWEKVYYGDILEAMRQSHPNMVPET